MKTRRDDSTDNNRMWLMGKKTQVTTSFLLVESCRGLLWREGAATFRR